MITSSAARGLAAILCVSALGACGQSAPPAEVLKKIGEACTANARCGSGNCSVADKVCTKNCTKQSHCPAGFDCGYAHLGDGAKGIAGDLAKGIVGATCYKANWQNPATGGYGANCGDYSPDPNSLTSLCDTKAMNPCADGFSCIGAAKCDANAVCTKACTGDADCPPTLFCATETAGGCDSDGDCKNGYTCQSSGGGRAGKVCTRGAWCKPREQCAPCVASEQCAIGFVCAADASGERYCGKTCDPSQMQACPESPGGTNSPFMQCVDSGTGAGNVCQPTQGACHGKSAFADLTTAGASCSWCRPGIPSDCPDGFCYHSVTEESFCTERCDPTATDTCPQPDMLCIGTAASGFCTGDSSGAAVTCYP